MEQMSVKPGRQHLCYRCGSLATTKEHVVPRCLYPDKPAAKLITVPACRSCNNALAKDEEYFRTILAAQWIDSPSARAVWEQKVRPSFDRQRDGLRKSLLANMRDIYLPSEQGFVQTGLLRLDDSRMDRVAEKIVRGLYFHVMGKVMPDATEMRFHWRPRDWLRDTALSARLISVDPDVFSCRYGMAAKGSKEVSIWWMLFYRSLMYVVTAQSDQAALIEVGG